MAMEDLEALQMTCFEIISYVGTAKSCYINAVEAAKRRTGLRCCP